MNGAPGAVVGGGFERNAGFLSFDFAQDRNDTQQELVLVVEKQIPPLRYAPVGMTKEKMLSGRHDQRRMPFGPPTPTNGIDAG